MATSFVFSNFAVAALQEPIGPFDTALEIHPDDVAKFPVIAGSVQFPIVIDDNLGNVEICYATSLTEDGTLTVLRGQEETQARSWLAGATVTHGFTAQTVSAQGALNPRGPWNIATQYNTRDVVVQSNISYVAVQDNVGQLPSAGSAYWMVLYQPQSAASTALSWEGNWTAGTAYVLGQMVWYNGRLWFAKGPSTGQIPAVSSAYWDYMGLAAGPARHETVLFSTAAVDNYVLDIPAGHPWPAALYDGMRISVMFQGTNTATGTTLQPGTLPPKPLRKRKAVAYRVGEIKPNALYEYVYLAATTEWIQRESPILEFFSEVLDLAAARLKLGIGALGAAVAAAADAAALRLALGSALLPIGAVQDYAGAAAPAGWLLCYGQAVSRTTYASLFTALGTAYGVGDGSTTFNLPDLRGRVVAGLDNMGGTAASRLTNAGAGNSGINGATLGAAGGADRHAQTAAELAAHTHTGTANSAGAHTHDYVRSNIVGNIYGGGFVGAFNSTVSDNTSSAGAHTHTLNVNNTGNGDAMTIVQPTMMLNKIIYAGV